MKKALPVLIVIAVGAAAVYFVMDFRTSRLTPTRLQEIGEAEARLAKAEGRTAPASDSSEPGEAGTTADGKPAGPASSAFGPPPKLVAITPEAMPEKAPDTFYVAFDCTNGLFVTECRKDWAPNGAERFYELVKNGFFTDMRLFRVVKGFVVQFGISGEPKQNAKWMNSNIPDDPVKAHNVEGTLTFATSGPDSRSSQLFINLADNSGQLDPQGFAPIGKVLYGLDVVQNFYSGYGENLTNLQSQIAEMGNGFLDKQFPKLDSIKRAYFVEKPEEEKPAAKTPPPAPAKHASLTAPATFKAKFETTKGAFVIECHRDWAPLGVDRFYTLIKDDYYVNAPFYRIITKPQPFVVQWGINSLPYLTEEWQTDTLAPDPVKESNTEGRVSFAMADNRTDTRTTQVFINLADNSRLDAAGFAPIGEVVEGMDVVRNLNSEYQDQADQAKLREMGEGYWRMKFPRMDSIVKATIME